MVRVRFRDREIIGKHRFRLFECDLVLPDVRPGLAWIPGDSQSVGRVIPTIYTPTGKGLGLDSSVLAPGFFQRSKRPCSRLIRPVYQ